MSLNGLIRVAVLIQFLALATGCSECDNTGDVEVEAIRYGTSFGFCVGYCIRDLEITSGNIVFKKSGWEPDIEEKTCSTAIQNSEWTDLLGTINYEAFFEMPAVIGCPDCADGGAEWIELIQGMKSHKITFEFSNEPEELSNLVKDLRTRLAAFEDCGD